MITIKHDRIQLSSGVSLYFIIICDQGMLTITSSVSLLNSSSEDGGCTSEYPYWLNSGLNQNPQKVAIANRTTITTGQQRKCIKQSQQCPDKNFTMDANHSPIFADMHNGHAHAVFVVVIHLLPICVLTYLKCRTQPN